MRNAEMKTPTVGEKQNQTTSEKKLVQARLSFKTIAPSIAKESTDSATISDGRKRKLSYEENKPNKVFCHLDSQKILKKGDAKDSIVIHDSCNGTDTDTDTVELTSHNLENSLTPQKADDNKVKGNAEELVADEKIVNATESVSNGKLKIKLPFDGRNKRRKSDRLDKSITAQGSDSSDIESISKNLNPLKKAKLLKKPSEKPTSSFANKGNTDIDNQIIISSGSSKNEDRNNIESDTSEKPLDKDVKKSRDKTNSTCGKDKLNEYNPKVKNQKVQSKTLKNKKGTKSNETTPVKGNAKSLKTECRVNVVRLKVKDVIYIDDVSNCSDDSVVILTEDECNESCTTNEEKPEIVDISLTEEETVKLTAKSTTPGTKKKLESRQRLKEDRETKIQKAKEEKIRAREEKDQEKRREREEKEEQKRKERDEKEEQRKKEKEDREQKRLAEIFARNEEKRKRDEAKEEERRKREEAKEEERRKKEDEKRRKDLEKEEADIKKKKASEAFTKFFVAPPKSTKIVEENQSSNTNDSITILAFRPFQVKCDMTLAPIVRKTLNEGCINNLDKIFKNESVETVPQSLLYLSLLKVGKIIPNRQSTSISKEEEDLIFVEDELEGTVAIDETHSQIQKYRSKYFLFHENRRPPFHGTWRKKSKFITPRRPLNLDKEYFDYEVDSADEWEEEDPGGESINGTDDEKESEDDDYEVDNELFVPHGHLSDEELQSEEEQLENNSRELQKAKLMLLQQEFAQEMKKKTEKIKPRLIGTVWENINGCKPESCPDIIWDFLNKRAMIFTDPPIVYEPPKPEIIAVVPQNEKPERLKLNDDLIKDLIRLIHGNRHNKVFLIQEFLAYACKLHKIEDEINLGPKKITIREKIDEMAEWTAIMDSVKKSKKKLCWVVSADILQKYSMEGLDTKNQWSYLLEPKRKNKTAIPSVKGPETEEIKKSIETSTDSTLKKCTEPLIKQNQKDTHLALIEMSPQTVKENEVPTSYEATIFKTASPESASPSINKKNINKSLVVAKVKKRVPLLMSVGRGDEVNVQTKNALISEFLQKQQKSASTTTILNCTKNDTDSSMDVILIE